MENLTTRLKAEAYAAALYGLTGVRPTIFVKNGVYSFNYTTEQKQQIKTFIKGQLKPKAAGAPSDIRLNLEPILMETGLEEYGGFAIVAALSLFILGKIT